MLPRRSGFAVAYCKNIEEVKIPFCARLFGSERQLVCLAGSAKRAFEEIRHGGPHRCLNVNLQRHIVDVFPDGDVKHRPVQSPEELDLICWGGT